MSETVHGAVSKLSKLYNCVAYQLCFVVFLPRDSLRGHHLVGLVVKASALRAEDPGFESACHGIFLGRVTPVTEKNWHPSGYPARRLAI